MTKILGNHETGKTHRGLMVFCLVFLFLLAVSALGWSKRMGVASAYLSYWCEQQGLVCEGEFTAIGPDHIALEALLVERDAQMPLSLERLDLFLEWSAFLKLDILKIDLQKPVLRGVLVDGAPSLYGLESIFASQPGQADDTSDRQPAFPEINIEDGRLFLLTDAGEISGTFEANGQPMSRGILSIHINPGNLSQGEAEVSLSKGDLKLSLREGALVGQIELSIEQAKLGDLGLLDGYVSGKLTEYTDDEVAFDLTAHANQFSSGQMNSDQIKVQARGRMARLESFDLEAVLKGISTLSFAGEGQGLTFVDRSMSRVEVKLDMQATEPAISGPVSLEINELSGKEGGAKTLTAIGDLVLATGSRAGELNFKGSVALKSAFLSNDIRAQWLFGLGLPVPLDAHGEALRDLLSTGLSSFQTRLDLDAIYQGTSWSLSAGGPSVLRADSGLELDIDPFLNQAWLRMDQTGFDFLGDVKLKDRSGTFDMKGTLDGMNLRQNILTLAARNVLLSPWSVSGKSLSAQITNFEIDLGERKSLIAKGEIGLSGQLPGLMLKPTRLIGQISALQDDQGWRVQTYRNSCVGFSSDGIAAGTLSLETIKLSLCPVEGGLVRQEGGQSVGRISLGELKLPFVTGDSTGTLRIEAAGLEWVAGDGFQMLVKGRTFHLPLNFKEDTLLVEAEAPQMSVSLTGGPAQITAMLGPTRFAGSMVPAQVTSDAFSFSWLTTEAGIDGVMEARRVEVSDPKDDPLYQPLVADFNGTLRKGIVRLAGPIRSKARNILIAQTDMNLRLADFTGEAQLRLEPLTFARGGLQPFHLSELLRGILINVRGGLSGGADFIIDKGALSGTGYVNVNNLIFDTLAAGTVTGVNGEILFIDILALTTYPSQTLTIDLINPGVPLSSGDIRFQVINGTTTRLESARWPFAGGRLMILPVSVTAGQVNKSITVEAEEWELEKLIEVFKIPDIFARGTVSGQFPIDIEGANIMVREARLRSDAKGGKIAYTGSVSDAVKGQNIYADDAFEALKDFDFTVMEVGANGNLIGNMVLSADILGNNQDVFEGRPIKFGLSFASDLSQVLRAISTLSTGETYIGEAQDLLKKEKNARQKKQ